MRLNGRRWVADLCRACVAGDDQQSGAVVLGGASSGLCGPDGEQWWMSTLHWCHVLTVSSLVCYCSLPSVKPYEDGFIFKIPSLHKFVT